MQERLHKPVQEEPSSRERASMNPAAHVSAVEEIAIRQGRDVREALADAERTWLLWSGTSGLLNEGYAECARLARERLAQMEEP